MKLNLNLPMIYINGKPAKQADGEDMKIGELLAIVVQNGKVPENKIHWQSKVAVKLALCGEEIEFGTEELGEIIKMIPGSQIIPWAKGPLLWLLDATVDDDEAKKNYIGWYGEKPHEEFELGKVNVGGSDTASKPTNGLGKQVIMEKTIEEVEEVEEEQEPIKVE